MDDHQMLRRLNSCLGEGNELPTGPLMNADEEAEATDVQKLHEFPTGPPIPYKVRASVAPLGDTMVSQDLER